MKWMLVAMCANGWTFQPQWCEPIQVFDTKEECVEVKEQLKTDRFVCVPKKEQPHE